MYIRFIYIYIHTHLYACLYIRIYVCTYICIFRVTGRGENEERRKRGKSEEGRVYMNLIGYAELLEQ